MRSILLLLLPCACQISAPLPQRIAVVDMQRAVVESKQGAAAKARLMERYTKNQHELDEEQARIKREQELGMPKNPGGMEELQRRIVALQQRYSTMQSELNAAEEKERAEVTKDLVATLSTLAAEKGLDLVVDRASVPYVKAPLDLTDDLVKRFDAPATFSADGGSTQ
jgi:outer membrane protein